MYFIPCCGLCKQEAGNKEQRRNKKQGATKKEERKREKIRKEKEDRRKKKPSGLMLRFPYICFALKDARRGGSPNWI